MTNKTTPLVASSKPAADVELETAVRAFELFVGHFFAALETLPGWGVGVAAKIKGESEIGLPLALTCVA
jgi:hypothetical protein